MFGIRKKINKNINIFNKPKRCRPNLKQETLLRRTKMKGVFKRFTDSDGDGVINGLDCRPFNKNKHNEFKYKPSYYKHSRDIEDSTNIFREDPINKYVEITRKKREKELKAEKPPWARKR